MPSPPKIHLHNTVLFITSSIEEGLMLPCNPLVETLIKSALARAQHKHPVPICDLLIEPTHIHLLVVVDNPEDISGFMCRFKTEVSHSINKLLGRKKRTIWCEGYDSPVLLDSAKAIQKIVYIYSNPAIDGLENTITRYPGINTWSIRCSGRKISTEYCPRIHRPAVPELGTFSPSPREIKEHTERLKREATTSHPLTITPDRWMDCFEMDEASRKKAKEEIRDGLKRAEDTAKKEREKSGRTAIGQDRLRNSWIELDYQPNRTGKRMYCLGSTKEIRAAYIAFAKTLIETAKKIYNRWKRGDFTEPYPLGLYPPSRPRVVNVLPGAAYC